VFFFQIVFLRLFNILLKTKYLKVTPLLIYQMNTLDNTLTINDINLNIKNKGFLLLDILFKEKGWTLSKNELNHIEYKRPDFGDLDYFEIIIDKYKVNVSVPIKHTPYQYKTSFDNYYNAIEYVEKRFKDFIS
jgi:hypothetical protein